MGTIVKLHQLRPLALSVVALVASASTALALDAKDFAAKLVGVYATSLPANETVAFGPATVSGNDITYDGITITVKGASEPPSKLGTRLTFHGVTATADGGYTADTFSVPDVDYAFEGGSVSVKNIVLKHIVVPNGKAPNVLDSTRLFGDASVGPIVLTVDGTPAFSIESISVSNSFKPSQLDANLAEIDSNGVTSGMKFDMSGAKDQEALAQARALGLVTVTGKALETLTWTLKDGHINISEVSVDFDKVGKLKFALDFTGYTPQFMQNLNAVVQAAAAGGSGDASAQQQQQTAMLLASLQTLFLNSASLRFDDAAITGKLLDMAAKEQGVARDALVDQLVAQLPAQMNEGNSDPTPPAVVKMVQAAARAYLANPHSIELRLAPKAPLGVLGIVAAAMQPEALVDQIGLKVLVNDREITEADAAKETGVAAPAEGAETTPPADQGAAAGSDAGAATGGNDAGAGSDRLTTPHSR